MSISEIRGSAPVRATQAPKSIPESLRTAIVERACTLLVQVRSDAARQVGNEYNRLDQTRGKNARPDPRARAVSAESLQAREAALKIRAVRLAVAALVKGSYVDSSAWSVLTEAMKSDEKLTALFPLAQIQTSHTALGVRRGHGRNRLAETQTKRTR